MVYDDCAWFVFENYNDGIMMFLNAVNVLMTKGKAWKMFKEILKITVERFSLKTIVSCYGHQDLTVS